jgi:hypothetical protein
MTRHRDDLAARHDGAHVETTDINGIVRFAVEIEAETLDEFDGDDMTAVEAAQNLAYSRVEEEHRIRPSDAIAQKTTSPRSPGGPPFEFDVVVII